MTPHPQPQRCIEVHDAGMGEHEYFVFYDGTYYATTDTRKKAEKIIEMLDATDEDYNVCCASHSSAASEQEIRGKVLDELCERCFKEIEKCEVAIRKYPSLQKSNTGSKLAFEVVIQWISELRSKQGGEQG